MIIKILHKVFILPENYCIMNLHYEFNVQKFECSV